jgi:hypothetical protein
VDAYGDSYYTQTQKVQELCLKEAPYNTVQQGPSKAVGPTLAAGISIKHVQNMQKTEGKDLPNMKQLPMQETSSSGILT